MLETSLETSLKLTPNYLSVYDFDTRVHLLAMGPGIPAGSTWSHPATQVDLAPTFLGLAGIDKPARFDGKSLVPILVSDSSESEIPEATAAHLARVLDGDNELLQNWRQSVFIEYYFVDENDKCVSQVGNWGGGVGGGRGERKRETEKQRKKEREREREENEQEDERSSIHLTHPPTYQCKLPAPAQQYPNRDADCTDLKAGDNSVCWGGGQCTGNCYPTETTANNFIALRSMQGSKFGNKLYAEFQEGSQIKEDIDFSNPTFYELYDMDKDPWSLRNLYKGQPAEGLIAAEAKDAIENDVAAMMHQELHAWYACKGDECP